MKFQKTDAESYYEVSEQEKDTLTSWVDRAVALCEPEDATGRFFVDNFIRDDKTLQAAGGTVVAIGKRIALHDFAQPEDLTDTDVFGGETWESGSLKGIWFDTSNPVVPDTFQTTYEAELNPDKFEDSRYSGKINIKVTMPCSGDDNYRLQISRGLHGFIHSKIGFDTANYVVETGQKVSAAIASDPHDIAAGFVRLRPFDNPEIEHNGLPQHLKLIADVLGIEIPDFMQ